MSPGVSRGASESSESSEPIRVRPVDAGRFDDVARILNPRGDDRACWCLAYRLTSAANSALRGQERADRVRELCADEPAAGMLAYAGDEPIGWCGVGPRARFERLARSRTMPPADDVPVWSVVCFVVRAGYRGRGVARALLDGAVEYARACGAPALEGYPVDPAGARLDTAAVHVGTTTLFEAAGFRRLGETAARSASLPRRHLRLDL